MPAFVVALEAQGNRTSTTRLGTVMSRRRPATTSRGVV
jgi:hypothetical protein